VLTGANVPNYRGNDVNGIVLAARLVVAIVLLVASLAKLADRPGSRKAVEAFGVPRALAGVVAGLLPVLELTAAALLLVTATARIGAGVALGLFAVFSASITRSIIRGDSPDCHCFGQLHSSPAGPKTLIRNALLAGIATFALIGAPGTSATAWIGRLSGSALASVIAGAVAIAVVAGAAALALSLLRRHGELLLRIDRLEEALGRRGIVVPEGIPAPPEGLPVGAPAPDFEIPDLEGELVRLEEVLPASAPLLLTFTDPGCGPCSALLPQIAAWQREQSDRLRVVLVSTGSREANLAHAREHAVSDMLIQTEQEVTERYKVSGTPSAVLIGPDGRIASSVHAGAEAISALVASMAGPPSIEVHQSGPGVGNPAPDVPLRTLDGQESHLAEQLSGRTAVLFWNPSCGFCQRMLPDLKRFAERPPTGAPSVVVVSAGDPDQNRQMGLNAPVLLDGSFATGHAFGATGTPSAVLVDEAGNVASGIAVGAPAVLELVGAQAAPAGAE
jgi:methylamine dehydrogenase accessory protein MauD